MIHDYAKAKIDMSKPINTVEAQMESENPVFKILVERLNLKAESHVVKTDDGYLLKMFRVSP